MRLRFRLSSWLLALTVAVVVGVVGLVFAFSNPGGRFEETLGLAWLFELRGSRPAPENAIVVAVDGRRLPRQPGSDCAAAPRPYPDRWPRSCHARLIDTLNRLGAEAIVYDVGFTEPGADGQDRRLAEAIRSSGRVALLQPIEVDGVAGASGVSVERLRQPVSELKQAAAGAAPFPLPKVPVRVSQFWAFKASLGDLPTLPALALQVRNVDLLPRFLEMLEGAGLSGIPEATQASQANLEGLMRKLRRRLAGLEWLPGHLEAVLTKDGTPEHIQRRLRALSQLYSGPDSYYFNLYGPPDTVPIYRADRLLEASEGPLPDLTGKVVFVGEARLAAADKDGFYTVFSQADGVDLSGVELAATAYANLLDQSYVHPARPWVAVAILMGFAAACGILAGLLPGVWAATAVLLVAAVHVGAALLVFAQDQLWLPVATPVAVQAPVAAILGLALQYARARRQRRNAARAVGYYVPPEVAENLVEGVTPSRVSELRYGACLATDIEGYTRISQTMPPVELAGYMNGYFETLVSEIEKQGGYACQTVADSVMGVWLGQPEEADVAVRACVAALYLQQAVDAFNARRAGPVLRTRVGLHVGWMALGHVGGAGHFAYTVTGDTPNVASRLENTNKRLGTRILASASAFEGAEAECVGRYVGSFVPRGKSERIRVIELLCRRDETQEATLSLRQDFEAALSLYEAGDRAGAGERFKAILEEHPGDGPCHYYLRKCSPRHGSVAGDDGQRADTP
jgi:adenylate cyclase